MRKTLTATLLLGGLGVGAYAAGSNPESLLYSRVVMPIMTSIDPETAHRVGVRSAALGVTPVDNDPDPASLEVVLWGRKFRNPVGLAAGYDKHAEVMDSMLALGFGFVEIGSVCPRPQPGNPRPRVFRLKNQGAIINRYGFNSEGMEAAAKRLVEYRNRQAHLLTKRDEVIDNLERIPGYALRKQAREEGLKNGIVGVNLGKNKESVMPSLVENAQGQLVLDDYSLVAERLGNYADYLVVNVSSPNTPNLRDLQGAKELTAIVSRLQKVRAMMTKEPKPPILIKIAPDITTEQAKDIAQVALDMKVDGIIISNTTITRPTKLLQTEEGRIFAGETGGLSGRPLRKVSTQLLGEMYKLTGGRVPLIGVGGVTTGQDAYDKIKAGASLVQLYSALALEGPAVVPRIKRELAELLRADGYKSVQEAVGTAHKGIQ